MSNQNNNEMSYEDYVHCQIVIHGQIEKPEHYHAAEQLAINYLFQGIGHDKRILDVGCGTGKGMRYLRWLGFKDVTGIELHPEKARLAGAYHGDIATFNFPEPFDLVYCSHAFEHMYEPHLALMNMMEIANEFIFILPYVDTGDPKAHLASFEIGTRVDDEGETVNRWFTSKGLRLVDMKMDSFREQEIWLRYIK